MNIDDDDCNEQDDIECTFVELLRVVSRMQLLQRNSDAYLDDLIARSKLIAERFSNASEHNPEITRAMKRSNSIGGSGDPRFFD